MLCHLAAATPGVFDYVIVNEKVEPAFTELCKVLKEVRKMCVRMSMGVLVCFVLCMCMCVCCCWCSSGVGGMFVVVCLREPVQPSHQS